MKKATDLKSVLALSISLTALAVSVLGGQPAIEWDGSHAIFFDDNDGPFVLGFQFRAESNITVTAVGAFDYLGNGLVTSHTVGIWRLGGGSPIAVATVPPGTAGSLHGQFRYVEIPGVWLSANSEYIIGASDFYGVNYDIYAGAVQAQHFSTAPEVTFLREREIMSTPGNLIFPAGSQGPAWINPGANFQFVHGPTLSISRAASLDVVLSWTTNATGYRLECAESMRPTTWNSVTNIPAVVGHRFFVSLQDNGSRQRYFRLYRSEDLKVQ